MSVSLATLIVVPFAIYVLRSITPQSSKLSLAVVLGSLHSLANYWESLVTKIVPDPYLDEVFHIPQAQAYCDAKYGVWDPKITTPPGLYVLATLKCILIRGLEKASPFCSVHALRSFNCLILFATLIFAYACRVDIVRSWTQTPEPVADALHTALNIVLFPPLFFFSGLFYSDVLSTCSILVGYKLFLKNRGTYKKSKFYDQLGIYILGIISLTIRQTNIFWFLGFLGVMELVQILSSIKVLKKVTKPQNLWPQVILTRLKPFADGIVYDVGLNEASVLDFILCAISIAIAIVSRPYLVIINLWPHIALFISFAGFVYWNGGVVLGDKLNHVATIHLPQMLYIWPLIVFFSAPLVLLIGIYPLLIPKESHGNANGSFTCLFKRRFYQVAVYLFVILIACLLIIRYNTIIHPFTLADNRHYMFYVFRYTILCSRLARFYYAPIYLICGYLVYLVYTPRVGLVLSKFKYNKTQPANACKILPSFQDYQGPTTSLVLILLISTGLSLVFTSLVEPRYFITPWVIWRLNVPFPSPQVNSPRSSIEASATRKLDWRISLSYWLAKSHDFTLWIETTWFLLINLGTCYIFLHYGFEWPQEPGKVQRFMW